MKWLVGTSVGYREWLQVHHGDLRLAYERCPRVDWALMLAAWGIEDVRARHRAMASASVTCLSVVFTGARNSSLLEFFRLADEAVQRFLTSKDIPRVDALTMPPCISDTSRDALLAGACVTLVNSLCGWADAERSWAWEDSRRRAHEATSSAASALEYAAAYQACISPIESPSSSGELSSARLGSSSA